MLKLGIGINRSVKKIATGSGYQPETLSYLNAVPIVNNTTIYFTSTAQQTTGAAIWNAVDAFVVTLKTAFSLTLGTNNLNTKFKAIYPFIGDTATMQKWNLVDAQDTNAAFRLLFSGGWVHSSTGALPNGVNTTANTFLTPTANLLQNSTHIAYYSRSNVFNAASVEMGIGIGSTLLFLSPAYVSGLSFRSVNDGSTGAGTGATNTAAFFQANRISSTNMDLYRNTSVIINDAVASTGLSAQVISIGQYTAAGAYTSRECAYASIGIGMTTTEQTNYYAAVQTLQTALFRQV